MRLAHPHKSAALAVYFRQIGADDTAEKIEADLTAAGRCRRCGRVLTDPVSVKRGIGPDCVQLEERTRTEECGRQLTAKPWYRDTYPRCTRPAGHDGPCAVGIEEF